MHIQNVSIPTATSTSTSSHKNSGSASSSASVSGSIHKLPSSSWQNAQVEMRSEQQRAKDSQLQVDNMQKQRQLQREQTVQQLIHAPTAASAELTQQQRVVMERERLKKGLEEQQQTVVFNENAANRDE